MTGAATTVADRAGGTWQPPATSDAAGAARLKDRRGRGRAGSAVGAAGLGRPLSA